MRPLRVGQAPEGAVRDQLAAKPLIFLIRPVAPIDPFGLGQAGDVVDPGNELRMIGRRGHLSPVTRGMGSAIVRCTVYQVEAQRQSTAYSPAAPIIATLRRGRRAPSGCT